MRDQRFKAAHRDGPLDLHRHRLLAAWAADCAEHVLPAFSKQHPQDERPQRAIYTARAWARGEVTVGEARAASLEAHAAARDADDCAARDVARCAGHAVGSAHMADHAPEAAKYAVQAAHGVESTRDFKADAERTWQLERVPEEIRPLIVDPGR